MLPLCSIDLKLFSFTKTPLGMKKKKGTKGMKTGIKSVKAEHKGRCKGMMLFHHHALVSSELFTIASLYLFNLVPHPWALSPPCPCELPLHPALLPTCLTSYWPLCHAFAPCHCVLHAQRHPFFQHDGVKG